MSYDLAEDSVWGLGIGCSGAVDIRIERIGDDAITNDWLTILERGEAAVLVTPLSGVSGRMIVRGTGDVVGGLTDPIVEQRAVASARARLEARYPASGPERLGSADVFYEIANPPPGLVIFGAGHDAAPVAQLAWTLGFAVTVVDVRETFLTKERFGSATRVCAHFSRFAEHVALGPGSFSLIMNHHVERDQESLRFSLESEAAYIGVLGPRSRYDKLLAGLAEQGYVPDPTRAARVRSPVGSRWGPRHQKKWRRPFWESSSRFDAVSTAGFSAAPSAAFTAPKTAALGQLVVFGRVDIHQRSGGNRKTMVRSSVPLQDRTSAVLELGELGEKLPLEQVRRRHDLTVADADDGRRVLAVGVEHRPVLVRGHERLIGEREHRGGAVGQVLDRRPERASHSGGELQVDGVAHRQPVERCQRRLVLAAEHDEDIVEAGGADLSDRAADERLVAKRQQELLVSPSASTHPPREPPRSP